MLKHEVAQYLYSKGFTRPLNQCSFEPNEEWFIYRLDGHTKTLVEGCKTELMAKRGCSILQNQLDRNGGTGKYYYVSLKALKEYYGDN